jgi:hypothetical protein
MSGKEIARGIVASGAQKIKFGLQHQDALGVLLDRKLISIID